MRKYSFIVVLVSLAQASTVSANGLIISEIVDATLPGGLPKWVELTNCSAEPVDLADYSIGNFNNGNTTLGGGQSTQLSDVTLEPGGSYVIAYENEPAAGETSMFETVYGASPDQYIGPFINGDDVLALFLGQALLEDGSDATLHDVYGVIGVDGSNEAWEYTDSYAVRDAGAGPSAVFDAAEWTIPGFDALEVGGDDAAEEELIREVTTPGSHRCEALPPVEVPSVAGWGLVVLTLALLGAGVLASRRLQSAPAA